MQSIIRTCRSAAVALLALSVVLLDPGKTFAQAPPVAIPDPG